jgi:hypothetical protein
MPGNGPPLRAWSEGLGREAGSYQSDAIQNISGSAGGQLNNGTPIGFIVTYGSNFTQGIFTGPFHGIDATMAFAYHSSNQAKLLGFDASRQVRTAAETRSANISMPIIIYLGQAAV